MSIKPTRCLLYAGILIIVTTILAIAGCAPGDTVSGIVTNSITSKPLAGVIITTDPVVKGVTIKTDANGNYSAELPSGAYTLTYKMDRYTSVTEKVTVTETQKLSKNIALKPTSPVVVSAGTAVEAKPGATVTLTANVEPLDGSTVTAYKWAQVSGPTAKIATDSQASTQITLADISANRTALMKAIKFEDRFSVQPINPHELEAGEIASFKVTVTTSSGTYNGTVNVVAELPYVVSSGLRNVPIGVPVLLHGKQQSAYAWSIAGPSGSKVSLDNALDQNPSFTPDVPGKYVVTEKNGNATINIYAGTLAGAISGQDAKGLPLSANCTPCHNGTLAPDKFTSWRQSGHAEIFTANLNTSATYGEQCFACHTVGFNKSAKNGGIDDQTDYAAFLSAGILTVPRPDNWTNTLAKFPQTARTANIQCENCHGPNNESTLHGNSKLDPERISISSNVCGACHGEPLRHGRFQQWEQSGHGNFELAIEEAAVEKRAATAAHCGRCHSGQGFLSWLKQGDLTKQIQGAKGNATVDELKAIGLTKDTVQPVTCVTCHDPHAQGTTSGEPNTATVRVVGDTPVLPAGFKATNVGKGAMCMTCHNSRNGLRNDANAPTSYSAPHTAAQTDVIMGENAFFVKTGARSPHSLLKDSCVTCHMGATPPPKEFSYNQAGTNHAFKASLDICSQCHKSFDAKAVEVVTEQRVEELGKKMSAYLLGKLPAQAFIKDYTPHDYQGKTYDLKSAAASLDKGNIASIEPTEPHGQIGFALKFKSPVSFTYTDAAGQSHTVSASNAQVQLGDFSPDGKASLLPVTDVLVKVGWNYFLIHGDGSEGIHNPVFTLDVLKASTDALK